MRSANVNCILALLLDKEMQDFLSTFPVEANSILVYLSHGVTGHFEPGHYRLAGLMSCGLIPVIEIRVCPPKAG